MNRKLKGLIRSRTHWANAILSFLVAAHPWLEKWGQVKLEPADYALFGAFMYGILNWLRWITEKPLDER